MDYQLTQYKTFWRFLRWWHLPQHLFSKGHYIRIAFHSLLFPNFNIPVLNFLDTTFDLINVICKPYPEPNDNPVYINKNPNHPPTVLRQLVKSITKRTSETSPNEQIFQESISIHKVALKKSGFHKKTWICQGRGRWTW